MKQYYRQHNRLVQLSKLAATTLFFAIPWVASAGGIGDGGGQAVVCRDDNREILSAELLDLFEAKYYFVRQVDYSQEPQGYLQIAKAKATQLDLALPAGNPTDSRTTTSPGGIAVDGGTVTEYLLNPWLLFNEYKKPSTALYDHAELMAHNKLLLPGNLALPPVGDSTPRVLPTGKGCNIEQVAVYSDGSEQVRFVEKIWNKFSETDKAALIIHEVLYRSFRHDGDTNSDRTRKLISYLFTGHNFSPIVKNVPLTHLSCWAKSAGSVQPEFHFLVYPQDPGAEIHTWATLQFVRWNGQIALTETKIRAPMDYFAKPFEIKALPSAENLTVIDKIFNELVSPRTYALSRETNSVTKESKVFIQARYGQFDSDSLEIKCRKKLSKITLTDDGFEEEL